MTFSRHSTYAGVKQEDFDPYQLEEKPVPPRSFRYIRAYEIWDDAHFFCAQTGERGGICPPIRMAGPSHFRTATSTRAGMGLSGRDYSPRITGPPACYSGVGGEQSPYSDARSDASVDIPRWLFKFVRANKAGR
jgi:hypothetical protein